MYNSRNLGWKLNWYRQGELEGALLLGRLIRSTYDGHLVSQLTRHCADEARHAWLWQRTISKLNLPTLHIDRTYQSFYLEEIRAPRGLLAVLALTHVFEQRVHRQFTEDLEDDELPECARRTFRALLRDEDGHLDWIARRLSCEPAAPAILARYREADERVYQRLLPYRDSLWMIAASRESDVEVTDDRCATERHEAQPEYSTQVGA